MQFSKALLGYYKRKVDLIINSKQMAAAVRIDSCI